jgi:3-hydroxy-9,10-secoandrosta-1,3,5(10)-triene-9,17-dione monooxygenase reductase component
MSPISDDEFRAVLSSFASGVTIVTAMADDGTPFGLTATAFCSVSRSPPTCLVCVATTAEAHPVIRSSGRFAVNILSRDQQALSAEFATTGADKFAGVQWSPGAVLGCPLLAGAIAHLECSVTETIARGDHDVLFGSIENAHVRMAEPLLYFRGRYADLTGRS